MIIEHHEDARTGKVCEQGLRQTEASQGREARLRSSRNAHVHCPQPARLLVRINIEGYLLTGVKAH
jgi:hypothetical protein